MKKLVSLLFCLQVFYTCGFGQWNLQPSGTSMRLESVFFAGESTGYVVGSAGTVLKTTNGGAQWTNPAGSNYSNIWFRSLFFNSADTGFVVGQPATGDTEHIFKTTDGGINWIPQHTDNYILPYAVWFTNSRIGYVAGETYDYRGIIFRTTDWGADWETIYTGGINSSIYATCFTDLFTGYAVGYNGLILKTKDAGSTWNQQTSGMSANLYAVFFLNVDTGFIAGTNGAILKTVDGGTHWTDHSVGYLLTMFSLYFPTSDTGFAVGEPVPVTSGLIMKTTDGGITWSTQFPGTVPLTSVWFTSPSTGYAVSENGSIYKTINGGMTNGLNEKHAFPLAIYPDPASESITVILPGNGNIPTSFAIYNSTGQEVMQPQQPGPGHTISVRSLFPGLYFIRETRDNEVYGGRFVKD
jgi:photosystem II stability/assembly factor-like uncharacterized protein